MRHFGSSLITTLVLLVLFCGVSRTEEPDLEHQKELKATENLEVSPKIQFDELSHDFGKTFQNSTVKHTFILKNVGTDTLHIRKVKSG